MSHRTPFRCRSNTICNKGTYRPDGGGNKDAGDGQQPAPRVVGVFRNHVAQEVRYRDYVPLQAGDIEMLGFVEVEASRHPVRIMPEVEAVRPVALPYREAVCATDILILCKYPILFSRCSVVANNTLL